MAPGGDGFRRQATRKGTIKLKTLRKPGVKDISSFFNKAGSLGMMQCNAMQCNAMQCDAM
jgi:hypothetical protein